MSAITPADYPALYRAADRTSVTSQRSYLRLVRGNLALIVASSAASAAAMSSFELRTEFAAVAALGLFGSTILTVLLLQLRPNQDWFGGRAVAESVKTIAWRYMMGAEPYGRGMQDQDADRLFTRELGGILRERSALGANLGGGEASADQITRRMREIRSRDLDARKRIYLEDRVQEQRAWYGEKADSSGRSSTRWLVLVATAQIAGAGAAISLIVWPDAGLDLASVLASAAAALLAWLQVKQHHSLAQAYGLAAHELGLIAAQACHVGTEAGFSSFVADAETAISREHTMWIARRDVVV